LSRSKERVTTLACSGSLLGFTEKAQFNYASQFIEPGDSVFLYTDGLLENTTAQGTMFNSRQLRKAILTSDSPQACTEALEKTVIAGSQEQPLEDDVTVYMFQWKNIITDELPQAG
jgi:serine phosphatase RsbU (regulator of sigma subunit)